MKIVLVPRALERMFIALTDRSRPVRSAIQKLASIVMVPVIALYVADLSAATENELRCGQLSNAYGPIDYRTATVFEKKLVENAHFTPPVEQGIRGNTGTWPGGDVDYTLRAFPNHPRALKTMMEIGFRTKTEKPQGANWPVWCYFDRAIRFKADDAQVRMVYGIYLQRKGKPKEAVEQLQAAQALDGENANIHYNLGLIYLDLGDYEQSLEHAHRAYGLGFQLEGLRNRLKRVNKWREPEPENPAPNPEETRPLEKNPPVQQ